MFVQEEKIFAGKVLKIHICTMDGAEWLEEVTEDTTVEKLKEKCLKHYVHGNVGRRQPPNCFPRSDRMADVSSDEKKQDNKAPDKDAILKATGNLSTRHTDRTVTQHNIRDVSFQTELRKILVSLIEVAREASFLFVFLRLAAMLDEDEEDRVDETALQQLTEMGFPESRAIKFFLILFFLSAACRSTQAMEWLIEHVDDPSVDAPIPGQDSSGAAGATQDELTEIFKRIRRKREFRPDSRAVIALMEMGFDEKEVVDGLRVNNNQQDCEWLLGDRKPSPEDLDKGIDTNSTLFQAILENPVVQLGLTNPKTLLATQWMNDPETGPVMLQISRIFQTLNRT
uniref:UBA domain containing 1 n=1 Tax=Cyclopterus lumpus TaxID=8103 RepID=A0A8C3AHP4_CYCLU